MSAGLTDQRILFGQTYCATIFNAVLHHQLDRLAGGDVEAGVVPAAQEVALIFVEGVADAVEAGFEEVAILVFSRLGSGEEGATCLQQAVGRDLEGKLDAVEGKGDFSDVVVTPAYFGHALGDAVEGCPTLGTLTVIVDGEAVGEIREILLAVVVEEVFDPHQGIAPHGGDGKLLVPELHLGHMHTDGVAREGEGRDGGNWVAIGEERRGEGKECQEGEKGLHGEWRVES